MFHHEVPVHVFRLHQFDSTRLLYCHQNYEYIPLRIFMTLQFLEDGAVEFFTKDTNEPVEFRLLPYDINSVMHFGNREFSKNGHKTIIFKAGTVEQNRVGLTTNDIRKFDIVYGPECLKRDRQEKIELCQSYPDVARRKRDTTNVNDEKNDKNDRNNDKNGQKSDGSEKSTATIDRNSDPNKKTGATDSVEKLTAKSETIDDKLATKSLRVNPNITPPPNPTNVPQSLHELGIEDQVQTIVENLYKVSATALKNARNKYCTIEKNDLRTGDENESKNDVLGIVNLVTEYAQNMVDNAMANLTRFCQDADSITNYERSRCNFNIGGNVRCTPTYRSTKVGVPMYSTQHRPYIRQSTKHWNRVKENRYINILRSNDTAVRRKREISTPNESVSLTTINEEITSVAMVTDKTEIVKENASLNANVTTVEDTTITTEKTADTTEQSHDLEVKKIEKSDLRMATGIPERFDARRVRHRAFKKSHFKAHPESDVSFEHDFRKQGISLEKYTKITTRKREMPLEKDTKISAVRYEVALENDTNVPKGKFIAPIEKDTKLSNKKYEIPMEKDTKMSPVKHNIFFENYTEISPEKPEISLEKDSKTSTAKYDILLEKDTNISPVKDQILFENNTKMSTRRYEIPLEKLTNISGRKHALSLNKETETRKHSKIDQQTEYQHHNYRPEPIIFPKRKHYHSSESNHKTPRYPGEEIIQKARILTDMSKMYDNIKKDMVDPIGSLGPTRFRVIRPKLEDYEKVTSKVVNRIKYQSDSSFKKPVVESWKKRKEQKDHHDDYSEEDRYEDRELQRDPDRERDRESQRDRDRESQQDRNRESQRDRESEQDQNIDRDRNRDRNRNRDRYSNREVNRDRIRNRERERNKNKYRDSIQYHDKSKEQSKREREDRERNIRDRDRDTSRESNHDRERDRRTPQSDRHSEEDNQRINKKIRQKDENSDRETKIREDFSNKQSDETTLPPMLKLSKLNKEFYRDRRWPGGIVRYLLKPGLRYDYADVRRRLEEVNAILKKRTCVRLEEITESQSEQFEDFLVIDNSPDYVTGRVGGKQFFGSVELLEGGQHRQHTAMMVMAMLGFYFEVSRHDRDEYIRVHQRHVRPDKLHHFEKIRSDATLPVPYDYASATHPAWQFWRQFGTSGISSVATFKQTDPDGSIMKSLGQNRELLSDTDILKINSVYGVRCFMRNRNHDPDSEEPMMKSRTRRG